MSNEQEFQQIKNYLETAKLIKKPDYWDLEDTIEGADAIVNANKLFLYYNGNLNRRNIKKAKEYGIKVRKFRTSWGYDNICELESDPRRSFLFG